MEIKYSYRGRSRLSATAQRLQEHDKIQALGDGSVEIYRAPDFLLPTACEALIKLTEAKNQRSTVADSNGDFEFRTSTTANFTQFNEVVNHVQRHITGLLGLPLANAEPMQGQRYEPGQQFKQHCDWFRPEAADYARYTATSGGQRTWTAMAYLNDVEEGGHTVFPLIGVDIKPRAGDLIMWNNLRPDGSGNPRTGHHAMPVIKGRKYVITQWYRQKAWGPWQ